MWFVRFKLLAFNTALYPILRLLRIIFVMLMLLLSAAVPEAARQLALLVPVGALPPALLRSTAEAAAEEARTRALAAVPTRASASGCLPAPLLRVAYPRLCFGLPTLRVWQAARQLALLVPRRVLLLLLARFCGHSSSRSRSAQKRARARASAGLNSRGA